MKKVKKYMENTPKNIEKISNEATASFNKNLFVFIFIISLICAFSAYVNDNPEKYMGTIFMSVPTTSELDQNSDAYNPEKAESYRKYIEYNANNNDSNDAIK